MRREAKNDNYFDSRISQRNIRDGKLGRDEFEKYLADLPDLADACDDIGEEIFGSTLSGIAVTGEFSQSEHEDEV